MKNIQIAVPEFSKKYTVSIGEGVLQDIINQFDFDSYSSIFIITDSNVEPLYLSKLESALSEALPYEKIHHFGFPAGEQNKNLETVAKAYNSLVEVKADRRTLLINLGGGVVSDLGGYVASTYLRGIPYITIPTTLESMVDASVGGKTGVNLGSLKNYVGVFTSPQAVIIDVDTLKTLPERALVQGFAEVIKHGLIQNATYFEKVIQKKLKKYSSSELIDIISGSVEIKKAIVQEDPHEKGVRKILNFGHTVGHVLESLSMDTNNPLFHGEAIAIGMVAEAYISYKEGLLENDEFKKIEIAIRNADLPVRYKTEKSVDELYSLLYTDKKTEKGSVKWTLLSGIGASEFNVVVNEKFAKEGIAYILSK
ncbi:3-dehydroquinate synthase [soil metagenome]